MRTKTRCACGAALVVLIGIAAAAWASGDEILLLGRLSPPSTPEALPDGWKPLAFANIAATTRYSIAPDGGGLVLKAESRNAASGLYRAVDIDPKAYPILVWRWKVENILQDGDERKKEGDDYAARIYVAFRYDPGSATVWEKARYGTYKLFYGDYPPKVVLNYIWANRLPKGAAIDNAFTDRAKMIAVQSGPAGVGRWVREERNLYDDYRRLFGQEPPRIAGIALMTDTDNTGGSAVAYYGEIALQPSR